MRRLDLIAVLGVTVTVAACIDGTDATIPTTATRAAERSCLRDVTDVTGNRDTVVLGSEPSTEGTLVRIGVGSNRAPWQCIAHGDGSTDGIQSLTDEGIL